MAIFLGRSPQAPPGPDPLTATPPPSWLLKEKEPLFFLSRSCARILFWGSSPSSKPTLPSMHFEGRRKRRAGKGLPLFQPGSKERLRAQKPSQPPKLLLFTLLLLFSTQCSPFTFLPITWCKQQASGLQILAFPSLPPPAFLQQGPPVPFTHHPIPWKGEELRPPPGEAWPSSGRERAR